MGIYPVDHGVFVKQDFAPSKASSSIAHVLASFPPEFTSSDPIEPSDNDAWPDSDLDDGDFTHSDDKGTSAECFCTCFLLI